MEYIYVIYKYFYQTLSVDCFHRPRRVCVVCLMCVLCVVQFQTFTMTLPITPYRWFSSKDVHNNSRVLRGINHLMTDNERYVEIVDQTVFEISIASTAAHDGKRRVRRSGPIFDARWFYGGQRLANERRNEPLIFNLVLNDL